MPMGITRVAEQYGYAAEAAAHREANAAYEAEAEEIAARHTGGITAGMNDPRRRLREATYQTDQPDWNLHDPFPGSDDKSPSKRREPRDQAEQFEFEQDDRSRHAGRDEIGEDAWKRHQYRDEDGHDDEKSRESGHDDDDDEDYWEDRGESGDEHHSASRSFIGASYEDYEA